MSPTIAHGFDPLIFTALAMVAVWFLIGLIDPIKKYKKCDHSRRSDLWQVRDDGKIYRWCFDCCKYVPDEEEK